MTTTVIALGVAGVVVWGILITSVVAIGKAAAKPWPDKVERFREEEPLTGEFYYDGNAYLNPYNEN